MTTKALVKDYLDTHHMCVKSYIYWPLRRGKSPSHALLRARVSDGSLISRVLEWRPNTRIIYRYITPTGIVNLYPKTMVAIVIYAAHMLSRRS